MENLRLKISNIDRVGMVSDISKCLAARGVNIISMEVELNTTHLETEPLLPETAREIMESVKKIPNVLHVDPIQWMPHQLKTEELKAVMAAVGEAIIAIDQEGRISHYNSAAEKIVRIPYQDVIGKKITDVFPPDNLLLNALRKGEIYNNREMIPERSKSHYLTNGRPIIDNKGQIIGAVANLKDSSEVRELVHSVTGQLPITFDHIIYVSDGMNRILTMAKMIARGDSTVLIRGETGTGKELFARALHSSSYRANKNFVPINCSAIPDALLESELFGYEHGAFTGAAKGGKHGLFEFADGGSIFLDEIGELPAHLQSKLLRVLQDGKVRRIGGRREIPFNVRTLAATSRDLEDMVKKGQFREDLYYRLNVIPLFIPPLRERKEDIPLLTQFFLQSFAHRLQKPVPIISDTALHKLIQYSWPGNIRELENVIERAVNILDGGVVLPEHVVIVRELKESLSTLSPKPSLKKIVSETERNLIAQALKQYRSSRQLGSALGLSHTALLKKIHKYGLNLPRQ